MAKTLKILAAVGMTAAAALAPVQASAQSYDYHDCKRADKDAQVIGGLIGAALGAVAGSQVAGRKDRTEGSVIGAVAGAAAGAGIADDRRNCTKEEYATPVRGTTTYRRDTVYTVPATTTYGGTVRNAHHPVRRNRNARNNRGYNDYGYGGYNSPWQVRQRIEQLKDEDRRLKRRSRYERSYRIDRRRDDIRREVKRLKRLEDRLEDRRDYRRDRRDDRRDYNRRDRHYHGSNVCYSRH